MPTEAAWTDDLLRNPHAAADKRMRVRKMFAAIAPSYDLNNRLHSMWMDQSWRRKAVKLAELKASDCVLDVACGTGDLTIQFEKGLRRAGSEQPDVLGLDFTYEMLPIARRKFDFLFRHSAGRVDEVASCELRVASEPPPQPSPGVPGEGVRNYFINGDALTLPIEDQSRDVISIAFGIRNVADPAAVIREFRRVLRPGGRLIILEFSLPGNAILRRLYNFYFRKILPRTATLISGDKTGAYKYLPESVNTFISPEVMQEMMRSAGFGRVEVFPMTFGVCLCYRGWAEGAKPQAAGL